MARRAVRLAAIALMVFGTYNLCSLWSWQFHAPDLGDRSPTRVLSSEFSHRELRGLERALGAAAFRNRTVIITTLNRAWVSAGILDLFLGSFRAGQGTEPLLDHLLIVAVDKISHDLCLAIHSHCYALRTTGLDFASAKGFMTHDFIQLMWRRIYLLGVVLELGYSFVFSDADVMWFRDPFQHFHPDADLEMACDYYPVHHGDSAYPNCGFMHAHANNRTLQLYKYWYHARLAFPGQPDQDVLTAAMFKDEYWDMGVKTRFLRTELFGSFCQAKHRVGEICTMHANCCIGMHRKVKDLQLLSSDWAGYVNRSRSSHNRFRNSSFAKEAGDFRWSAPRECLASMYKGKSVYIPVRKKKPKWWRKRSLELQQWITSW
ncbi:uncharacterized protein At1g28695-like [Selaginella moellendorffii]|uniref:uncharacterized protein At1g28695-like n=1 Tax=Selaginella moellendorffii TaxID=88036 RepID=UPI000D1CEE08|nr:uncharacterized protein At1g28695-like [Selaginella moellendorffii]|eukprot:XP_024522488.1 uncharacterized protein At1g28695-like [Selaginella moellendorffii]